VRRESPFTARLAQCAWRSATGAHQLRLEPGEAAPLRAPTSLPSGLLRFADDGLDKREATKVERVAALLRRHPRLRIRIHGYAQPEAPSSIGEALAQARATSVRQLLLTLLQGEASWEDEDANEGVRSDRDDAVWLAPGFAHTHSSRGQSAAGDGALATHARESQL
tara:strand:+ start:316 stop:813 length:498 start_codon:yes stop_codon:yes gene_type:complete